MTRVLALTNLYPPHYLGGYETTCRDVVERLRRRGHDATVLTSSFNLPDVSAVDDEQAVDRTLELTSHFGTKRALWRRPLVERSNLAELRRILTRRRPEVVMVWNMMGLSLSLLTELARVRIPLVFVLADDWVVASEDDDAWMRPLARHPIVRGLAERVWRVPTQVPELEPRWRFCFASQALLQRCERLTGERYPNAEVTPLGVDLDDFPQTDAPATSNWAGRLLFVGRLHKAKGVETLLEAMASMPPDVTLELLGRGDPPFVDHMRRTLTGSGLTDRVTLATAPRADLRRHYLDADVCVFPSEWEEPFGIVPLEAMACGTPVIATGVGGSGEYLRDGDNCLLFPPGDPSGLVAAVARLAGDPQLRDRLVSGGHRAAATYTVEALTDRLEAALVLSANADEVGRS